MKTLKNICDELGIEFSFGSAKAICKEDALFLVEICEAEKLCVKMEPEPVGKYWIVKTIVC